MDFDLSDEQRLLKDSVERLLADRYDAKTRDAAMHAPDGFDHEMWSRYAELGLLGLPFPEEHGGIGGGPIEIMIVAEAFGRALVLEPYFATVVLAGGLLRHAGSAEQKAALVPRIAEGSLLLAFAHSERQSRYDLADVMTTARRDGDGWVLDGAKSLVLHGDCATTLIVSTRIAGSRRDRDGIALFMVDAASPGVLRQSYPTIDGMRAAEVTLTGVRVGAQATLGLPGATLAVIERVVDEAIAALAAEAVGAMAVMHELTLDYLKTRKQFGVPIGSFQILQHRAVDMLIALEQARSMAMLATMTAAEPDASERHQVIAAAKVQIGRSARLIGQIATQLHGGIGMTMEYRLGAYFKRVTAIDALFGDADHHLGMLGRSMLPVTASPTR